MYMRNAHAPPSGRRVLSRTAEHALRAALYLARRRGNGLLPAGEIAAALGTPPNYTGKTLRQLTRKGLLRSVRGPRGGFALGVEPTELSVSTLLDAVEGAAPMQAVCLLGDRLCNAADPCGAHARWMEVQNRTNELLTQTTLADLLGDEDA